VCAWRSGLPRCPKSYSPEFLDAAASFTATLVASNLILALLGCCRHSAAASAGASRKWQERFRARAAQCYPQGPWWPPTSSAPSLPFLLRFGLGGRGFFSHTSHCPGSLSARDALILDSCHSRCPAAGGFSRANSCRPDRAEGRLPHPGRQIGSTNKQ